MFMYILFTIVSVNDLTHAHAHAHTHTHSSNQRFYPPPKEEPIHHLADPDTCQEYKYDYAAIEDSDAEARHQKGVRTRSDYAEIDDEDDSEALYAEARHQKGVRMRRTQCKAI